MMVLFIFHLSTSREKARLIKKWLDGSEPGSRPRHKVIKVSFDMDDFVCVGNPSDFDRRSFKTLNSSTLDNICVYAYRLEG